MNSHCPYPGLRPFERDETDIFFGREEHTDQLLARLEHTHFLAVVGPSGCGKSSLVRTGLLAGLESGFLSSAGARWRIAELRPGSHPFANLTDALLVDSALGPEYLAHVTSYFSEPAETTAFLAAGSHRAMLQAQLRRGPLSIQEILKYVLLPGHTRLLILVDQFEEIFRYYQQGAEDEAAAFVSLLLAASAHPDVYVVITMRSDFLGDCALFHGLPEAINQGLFLTPRLNREQLRAAIEEPAAVFGGKIEPALVNRLLNDAGNNPDQLPIVQHALMRMWTIASTHPSLAGGNGRDEGITLTMDHYVQIGGLEAALSQHADEAYHELDPSQHKIAEIMFRSLSERGSDRRDTRRPVALSEVATLAKVPWQQVATVIEVFRQEGRSFLTPPVGKDLDPESVVDISHESLIRQWQRLQDWTTQEAEAAELYQRLEDSACRWEKGEAALWRTPELENALAWRDRVTPTPEWAKRYGQHFDLAMRFLDASTAQQRDEAQQVEAARQRELRQARRQVTLLVLGLMMAIGLALWAIFMQRQAQTAKQEALQNFRQATKIVEDFLTKLDDEKVKDVQGFELVRKELGEIGLKYYREFAQKRGDDPTVRTWIWYNLGVSYSIQGQLEEAIAAYRKQLEIKPDDELAWNGLGNALSDQQKLEEAIAAYRKQLEIKPDHKHAWHGLGNALAKEGHLADAIAAYQQQVQVKPDHEHAWHGLGITLAKQGQLADAIAAYQQQVRVRPEHKEAWNNLGFALAKQGQLADAIAAYRQQVQVKPDHEQAWNNLGNALWAQGMLADAIAAYRQQLAIKPDHDEAWNGLGITLAAQGQLEEAIAAYRQQLAIKPDHEQAWNGLGNAVSDQGQLEEAIVAYRKQLAIKPNHELAWYNLGITLVAQGQLEEAIAAYRQQLAIKPNHEHAWNGLGNALTRQGQLEEAIAAYRKQLAIKPNHELAWYNLGNTLARQGQLEEAIAAYRKQLAIKPNHEHAWNGLGNALSDQGNLADAIVAYRTQLEIKPDHDEAWNGLGNALARQGNQGDAIAAYRTQLEIKPDHDEAWNGLGNALSDQGQLADAIAAYHKQLEIKPDHNQAWNGLGNALSHQGQLADAIVAYRKQLEIKLDHELAWNGLSITLARQGQLADAIAAYLKHLQIKTSAYLKHLQIKTRP